MDVETQPEIQEVHFSRLPDGVVEAKMGGMTVYVRESDGFFKVSMLAKGRRDWNHWQESKDAKCKIARAEARVRGQVIEKVTTGPQIGRGVFAHYRVAVRFAEWVDPEYEALVEDVMARYHAGDMSLVAETVANHDAIQDTTSVVAIQSIGNNLFAADNLTLEQKRAKSIELTKRAHNAIARKGASRSDFVRIHDGINNAAFDFCGPTQILRDRERLPRRATPRRYAQPDRQEAVMMMTILATGYYNQDALSKTESQGKSLNSFKVMGDLLKDAGISTGPLLTRPIVPDRSLEEPSPSRPAIVAGPPMGLIRNQRQIDDFFNVRSSQ